MRRVTREWDHMSIFPASDATLAIDVHVPTGPSWPSEACEGWSGHWPGQERSAVIESVSAQSVENFGSMCM